MRDPSSSYRVWFDTRTIWTDEEWAASLRRVPDCWVGSTLSAACARPTPTPGSSAAAPAAPAVPPRALVEEYVRQLIVTLQLPAPAPLVGPDPSVNEWGMAVVGHPLWLWTEGPRQLSASRTAFGVTFTLNAALQSTTFDMGDGKAVTCTSTAPYPAAVAAGTPSPVCGHVYAKPSLPRGPYSVRATSHWTVAWSALGYSGTLPATMSASRELPVGELQAVVTG